MLPWPLCYWTSRELIFVHSMKTLLLLQMEDRKLEPLTTFLKHNKQTCLQNNIKYVFIEKSQFHAPPYWQKIFELDKCMAENPTVNYVMWLDSDAFLVDFSQMKMNRLLEKYKDRSVIIARDMPPWTSCFNAGSFIVKNNTVGRNILKEWIATYNPNKWIYQHSKWKTESKWAGEDYEQGAFVKHILPKYDSHIAVVPYYILNNNKCTNLNKTISVHLASGYKQDKSRVKRCIRTFTRKRSQKYQSSAGW